MSLLNKSEKCKTTENHIYTCEPSVKIIESQEKTAIFAELPGVSSEKVDITIENDILTIEAPSKPILLESYKTKHQEFYERQFKKSFKLSQRIDQENIEAKVQNGLLKLILPINKKNTKKISIKSL